jgi:hypothetical protein
MNSRIHSAVTRRLARRGVAVFAFLALAMGLARPICDAYLPHGGPEQSGTIAFAGYYSSSEPSRHADSKLCSTSAEDGRLVEPAAALTPVKSPAPLAVATASLPGWRTAALARVDTVRPDRPSVSHRYHARSARILI